MNKTRITWTDLPDAVTSWVESTLGSPVVEWRSQPGGWSPGTADRLVCADGTRAFLKAVHPRLNEVTPTLYRDEIRVARLLGPEVPCAHLLAALDEDDWVALLFEDIEGRHPLAPWRAKELRAALDALDAVAAATAPLADAQLPDAREMYAEDFNRFAELTPEALGVIDTWLADHHAELVVRGARSGELVSGSALGHADLRADNILVEPNGGVRIVDWPNACRSAPWIDGVLLAPNIENLGGLRDDSGAEVDPLPLLVGWASAHGATADDVLDVLVGMLAYYTWASMQPVVRGLPTLRRDQAVAAAAARRVVRRLWPADS